MPQFHLIPFPTNYPDSEQSSSIDLNIDGQIERNQSTITIHYEVSGDLSKVLWPTFIAHYQRKDGLWKHTCFELFILPANNSEYYEYNFSPSGNWNAYIFDDYRKGQQDLPLDKIEIELEREGEDKIILNSSIPLIDAVQPATFKVGISAVIEDQQHQHHYYALSHIGERPDFHIHESFTLALDDS